MVFVRLYNELKQKLEKVQKHIPEYKNSIETKSPSYSIQLFVLLVSYIIYLFTMSPTVYWNDSGELITAVHSLGMAHSPSFPLYVLVAKFAGFLPLGSIAFRVNLISVIFGCLTILILFKIIYYFVDINSGYIKSKATGKWRQLTLSKNNVIYYVPAIAASFILAFTHTFWLQSLRAEVYTLNTFLACLLIYLLSKYHYSEDGEHLLYLVALIYGLSLCNHSLLTIYLAPAILYVIIIKHLHRSISPKVLCICFFFSLLGLSLYLYLPIRSVNNPVIDWNNPETMGQFLNAFSRKRNLSKFFAYTAPLERIEIYVFMMIKQFTFFCYWIGIIGIWRLFKKRLSLAVFTTLIFLFNMVGTVSSSGLSAQNPDISGYLTISYIIYAIWIGMGLGFFLRLLLFKGRRIWRFVRVCALLMMIFSPFILFCTHFHHSNKYNHYFARHYGMSIIRSIGESSIFFMKHDNTAFCLMYLVFCERYGSDIRLIGQEESWNRIFLEQKKDLYAELSLPNTEELRTIQRRHRWLTTSTDEGSRPLWGMKVLEQMVFNNVRNYRVYWESGKYDSLVERHLIPNGLIFRISEKKGVGLTPAVLKMHDTLWNMKDAYFLESKEFLSDMAATQAYSFSLSYLGNYFRKRGMFHKAADYFEKAVVLSPNKPQAINDLGYCYLQMGRLDKAEREFLTVLELFGYYEEAHLNLGVVYARRGDYQKAKQEWKLVLESNPESVIAKENLEKLRMKNEEL